MAVDYGMTFPSFFWGNDPNVNAQLRQRIALAMIASKRKYPSNIGEGLSAIGDAIGDIGLMKRLEAMDKAQQEQAKQELGVPAAPSAPAPVKVAYAPAEDVDGTSAQGQATTRSPAPSYQAPPQLTTAPVQPASVLQSNIPVQLTAPQATLADLRAPGGGQGQPSAGPEDGGYNYIDAAADAPKPGEGGATPDRFANVRYNNPGAQYPNADARRFGSTGTDIIGGGHPIARFPSPVHGAASNFALLSRGYTGMPIGAAIAKWSGGGRGTVPGYDPNTVITPEMVNDPAFAVPFMQAVSRGEAPGNYPMSQDQWNMAHQWFRQGGEPTDPRARVADALTAQQRPPVMAFDGTPDTNFNANNFLPSPGTPAASPQQPRIQAAPPVRMAQASGMPQAGSDYVTPMPEQVPDTSVAPMSPREVQLRQIIARFPNNEYVARGAALELQQLQAAREFQQTQNAKRFESDLITRRGLIEQRAKDLGTQTERVNKARESQLTQGKALLEIGKMQDEAGWRARFGPVSVDKVEAKLDAGQKAAAPARNALIAANNIRNTLDQGAITGAGADWRLTLSKVVTGLGLKDKSDVVANTESVRAYAAPIVSQILKSTVGTTQVSDADRRFAQDAAGGNINLDEKTIRRLMDFIEQNSRFTIEQHQRQLNAAFPEGAPGREYGMAAYGVDMPNLPQNAKPMYDPALKAQDDAAADWASQHPDDPRAAAIWKKLGYKNAPVRP